MTKQKLLAALTALCCSASMAALNTSADYLDITESEDGRLLVETAGGTMKGILIETDGTVLTEDMLNTIEESVSLKSWDEWKASVTVGWWEQVEANIDPNGEAYVLSIDDFDQNTLSSIGRKLMLELDCIEDISFVDYKVHSYGAVEWRFYITPIDPELELNETVLPEFSGCRFNYSSTAGYWTCYDYYGDMLGILADSGIIDSEYYQSLSSYDKYLYCLEFCDSLVEAHGDILASVEPEVTWLENETTLNQATPTSVWLTAGDPNSDGAVDAADAADVLQTAADNGAAAADAQTPATPATDVNADGTVDAADAAAILQYAAAEGAGLETDWVEILK